MNPTKELRVELRVPIASYPLLVEAIEAYCPDVEELDMQLVQLEPEPEYVPRKGAKYHMTKADLKVLQDVIKDNPKAHNRTIAAKAKIRGIPVSPEVVRRVRIGEHHLVKKGAK